jgi:hypothetical protein
MPRQPFLPVFSKNPTAETLIGGGAIGKRPALELIIGQCLLTWPIVEAEMGLLLGQLLGTQSEAAIAVFQVLRRATGQREALIAAIEHQYDLKLHERELLFAIVDVHKSIEAARNALAHGHFGISEAYPDIMLWTTAENYISYKTHFHLAGHLLDAESKKEHLEKIFFYSEADLKSVFESIDYAGKMWVEAINWIRTFGPQREKLYHQLCDQSRIAEALKTLRQKNNPSTQPRSP